MIKKESKKNELYPVSFSLGGSKFSGAEKRILLTASRLAALDGKKALVVVRKDLYSALSENDNFSEDLKNIVFKKLPPSGGSFPLKVISRFLSIFLMLYYLRGANKVHAALYGPAEVVVLLILRIFGKKTFIEVTSPDVAVNKSTYFLALSRIFYSSFVSVSESVTNQLCGKLKRPKIYTRKVPYCERDKTDHEVEKKNRVVFAHRLIERKNPLTAAKAFGVLADKYPDWEFLIYGAGPLENEIYECVKLRNLSNFKFLGYANGLNSILAQSKIFVSLIEPDNYPSQSVIEAFSKGNFVVFSDTGDSRKYFGDEVVSKSVELSVPDIACAIGKIIELGDHTHLVSSAKEFAECRFSIHKYLEDSERVYFDL